MARAVGILDALSPMKVLARGYAMATDETGRIVKRVEQLNVDDFIELRLVDGRAKCHVDEVLMVGADDGRKENDV